MSTGAGQGERVADVVAIIGSGLIGGSLGLALKASKSVAKVIAVARSEGTLAGVREVGAADETTHDLAAAVAAADLVVLATPVSTILAQLGAIGRYLKPGCLVTDVGSTKAEICRTAQEKLPDTVDFVGGHPMAGSEQAGIGAARADLFQGATWVLTPTEGARPQAVDRVRQMVAMTGAETLVLSPQEHDRLAAAVSHVPHVLAAALADQVGALADEHDQIGAMAAGGFRDMTRVADGDPDLWRDILATNQMAVTQHLGALIDALHGLNEMLTKGDLEGVRGYLEQARRMRRRLCAPGSAARGE